MAELEESLEMSHPKPPQLSAAEMVQKDGEARGQIGPRLQLPGGFAHFLEWTLESIF